MEEFGDAVADTADRAKKSAEAPVFSEADAATSTTVADDIGRGRAEASSRPVPKPRSGTTLSSVASKFWRAAVDTPGFLSEAEGTSRGGSFAVQAASYGSYGSGGGSSHLGERATDRAYASSLFHAGDPHEARPRDAEAPLSARGVRPPQSQHPQSSGLRIEHARRPIARH
eukprot:g10856.t1